MTNHICYHEKRLVYKYALTYLRMRKSSYARVAKKVWCTTERCGTGTKSDSSKNFSMAQR